MLELKAVCTKLKYLPIYHFIHFGTSVVIAKYWFGIPYPALHYDLTIKTYPKKHVLHYYLLTCVRTCTLG